MGQKDDGRNIDLEWAHRVLCSDESCIGTIGADGCCKECGKPYEGNLPVGFDGADGSSDNVASIPMDDEGGDRSDAQVVVDADGDQDALPDDEWARRRLCSDESCIGVIEESTGCCKECGKPCQGT